MWKRSINSLGHIEWTNGETVLEYYTILDEVRVYLYPEDDSSTDIATVQMGTKLFALLEKDHDNR